MSKSPSFYRRIYQNNPWWIPPYILGRTPDIEKRLMTLLGFMAFALLFENYDMSLLGATLKYIAADLNIRETELSQFNALIRLGALPAFILIPWADQIGRRRLFIGAIAGLSIGTGLSAFSQTAEQFIFFQIIARTFLITASAISVVIITEEFPAEHRGWGIGVMTAIGAFGHGLGALMFGFIDSLPYGWRALYLIGMLPVFLLPLLLRRIPETSRYLEHQSKREVKSKHWAQWLVAWIHPIIGLFRKFPARASGIALVGIFASFGHAVVFAFIGYFVLDYHQWAPWQYSMMVIICGLFGLPGNVIAGHLADRFGRRVVGFAFMVVFPIGAFLFYLGPSLTMPIVWIGLVFSVMGGNVIIRALSAELFPTEMRGTSTGLIAIVETLGAFTGLIIMGSFTVERGDLIQIIPWFSLATAFSAIILLVMPETSRRELENISN
ncbi:MAG: MFS transporter [Pseudomonadota bacterium]